MEMSYVKLRLALDNVAVVDILTLQIQKTTVYLINSVLSYWFDRSCL